MYQNLLIQQYDGMDHVTQWWETCLMSAVKSMVNWTFGNKFQWNFNRNLNNFIKENANLKMSSATSRPFCLILNVLTNIDQCLWRYMPSLVHIELTWENPPSVSDVLWHLAPTVSSRKHRQHPKRIHNEERLPEIHHIDSLTRYGFWSLLHKFAGLLSGIFFKHCWIDSTFQREKK